MSANDYWLNRLQLLQAAIDKTIGRFADAPDRENFARLLVNLRDFGERQFRFFYDALERGKKAPKGFSQENAMGATLDQIGFDLTTITQSAWQRRFDTEFHDALDKGDQIVKLALEPAADLFLQKMVGFTYLQKSPGVRVIPYANVALVGLPYSVLKLSNSRGESVTRDFLATPHEVGHFVFWRARLPVAEGVQSKDAGNQFAGRPLRHALEALMRASPEWLRRWTEETFADVYGARVGGLLMAVDFQDIEDERNSSDTFYDDDGDHPVPVLRPEIYARTLEAMPNLKMLSPRARRRWEGRTLKKARSVLNRKFRPKADQESINKRDLPLMRFKSSSGRFVKVKDGEKHLRAVVEGMNALLPKLVPVDLFSRLPTRLPGGREDFAHALFDAFDGRMSDMPARRGARTNGDGEAEVVKEEWLHKWDSWRDGLLDDARNRSGNTKWSEKDEWLTIARAGGWTTEGPQSDPSRSP